MEEQLELFEQNIPQKELKSTGTDQSPPQTRGDDEERRDRRPGWANPNPEDIARHQEALKAAYESSSKGDLEEEVSELPSSSKGDLEEGRAQLAKIRAILAKYQKSD